MLNITPVELSHAELISSWTIITCWTNYLFNQWWIIYLNINLSTNLCTCTILRTDLFHEIDFHLILLTRLMLTAKGTHFCELFMELTATDILINMKKRKEKKNNKLSRQFYSYSSTHLLHHRRLLSDLLIITKTI